MLLDKIFNYYASRKWGKVGVRRGKLFLSFGNNLAY